MYISPKEFAHLLKSSTLNAAEQHGILKLLPSLTSQQIQEIGHVLMADHESQNLVVRAAEKKAHEVLDHFDDALKSLSNYKGEADS